MSAQKRSVGKKHRLLFYKHAMDRLWRVSLLLDFVLWTIWGVWRLLSYFELQQYMRALTPPRDFFILASAIILLVIVLVLLVLRNMAYVQAREDHILVATPAFRMKVAYRRVKTVRTVEFGHLYEVRRMSWADRRFFRAYSGRSVITVATRGLPMSRWAISLFLPKQILNPKENGFAFLVPDWMGLSTEIESYTGSWRGSQVDRPQTGFRGTYSQ